VSPSSSSASKNSLHPEEQPGDEPRYDVIIIGAGPVGSLLGCLLGMQNLRVLILEKRGTPPAHSMAIGITPPSLRLLSKLQLGPEFVKRGVCVRDCFIHGASGYLGKVDFRGIPAQHPFILSLQQSTTTSILQKKLSNFPSVTLCCNADVLQVLQQSDSARVTYMANDAIRTAQASYVVGCDGIRSRVRECAGLRGTGKNYRCHFLMADFADESDLGSEAHLFFTAQGSVESFPLPNNQRRWIVQTESRLTDPPPGFVARVVRKRTGIELALQHQLNESTFTPRWFNCDRYHHGRIILCGDAAHSMSPIGGQGMNTGFADAEFLAEAMAAVLHRGQSLAPLLAAYSHYRRRAARSAISRAGWGMWLGTWRGRIRSKLRDFVIRHILCKGPISRHMGPFYAMLTIPYNSLDRVPVEELKPAAA
jgi:2-polyprenyl-6-methoxyphenol hydroxylase-like FAD-dependent oxidoreductase